MPKVLLEVCCGSAEDVIQAERGGADRAELNASLVSGGLTPTIGALSVAKRHCSIPILTMVRPRAGGFCYTPIEFEVALREAELLLEHGADGLVFGFLHEDGTVDAPRCREMIRRADGLPCVFHRALDVVPDWKRALDTLISLGVTRVLTSGQQSSALLALETLREMIEYAAGAIEILPGAGIRRENVRRVVEATGASQVHLSARRTLCDPSASGNPRIHYGAALYAPEDRFEQTDASLVRELRALLTEEHL